MTDTNPKGEEYLYSVQKNIEDALVSLKKIACIDFIKMSRKPEEAELKEFKDSVAIFFSYLFSIGQMTSDMIKDESIQDIFRFLILSGLLPEGLSEENGPSKFGLPAIIDNYMCVFKDAKKNIMNSRPYYYTQKHLEKIKRIITQIISEIEQMLEIFQQDLLKTKP